MTDVAQILGVSGGGDSGRPPLSAAAVPLPPPPPPHQHLPNRAMQKMQGAVSREVLHLIGGGRDADLKSASLPPMVPTFTSSGSGKSHVKVGGKLISTQKPARPWAWAPFTSSARTDGALFYHWVRANVEYLDYPYSRFDVHLDPVVYTDEDYRRFLADDNGDNTSSDGWIKSETDALMDLARRFELRWAVIHDRWIASFPPRNVEDLQHRYYSVAAKLAQVRIAQEAAAEVQTLVAATPTTLSPSDDPAKIAATEGLLIEAAAARAIASSDGAHQPLIQLEGTGSSNKAFDLEYERERRAHLNALWNRSKEDEQEELEIRRELKQVEAQLRKLKKSGAHILAANALNAAGGAANGGGAALGGPAVAASAASSRNPSRSVSPQTLLASIDSTAASLDSAFQSTAPVPTAQIPYLQSGRLVPPACGGASGINKSLLSRMDTVLAELKVEPSKLVPTKRVCDLYDAVRKDVLTLLILQKNLHHKEGALQSKRLKLAKMGGKVQVMDEEALMGIVPPPPPPQPAAGTVASSPTKGGSGKAKNASKAKNPSGGTGGTTGNKPKAKSKSSTSGKPKSGDGTAVASGTAAAATGMAGGVKDAPAAGKQPRKPSVKRKRKSDSAATPAPAPVDTANAATAPADPAAAAEPAPTATKPDEPGKQAKKRSKKAPP